MKIFINTLVALVFLSFSALSLASNDSVVIEENDFQQLAQKMKQEKRGLLLMFHAEFCPYCQQMDQEILSPMVKSGEYDSRIFIRKLQIDEARDVIDFQGKTVEPSDISDDYNAMLTPTLVFLDYEGKEMVKQMVGINTIELFNAYLDEEIDKMMQKINPETETAQKN